jgi:hypothetical protein
MTESAERLERWIDLLIGISNPDGVEVVIAEMRGMLAASRAPAEAGAPEGFVLVPLKATQQICQVMQWKLREWPRYPFRVAPVYEAAIREGMLAAATASPKQEKA